MACSSSFQVSTILEHKGPVGPLENLMCALEVSEKRVVDQDNRTATEFDRFMTFMQEKFSVAVEENRELRGQVISLKGLYEEADGLHNKELAVSRKETEAAKQEIATLKEAMIETARRADERVQTVIAEQAVAVHAAIQSGDARVGVEKRETEAAKLEIERLRAEIVRERELAVAERNAVAVAEAQRLQGVIASLQRDLREAQTKSDQKDALCKEIARQKEDTRKLFSCYATLTNSSISQLVFTAGRACVPHRDGVNKLKEIIDARLLRKDLGVDPIVQEADNQKVKEVVKAFAPVFGISGGWLACPIAKGTKQVQDELVDLVIR